MLEGERFARSGAGGQAAQWSAANLKPGADPRRYQYALSQSDTFPRVSCKARPCARVEPGAWRMALAVGLQTLPAWRAQLRC